jgi:excisionase family DNA binding protein
MELLTFDQLPQAVSKLYDKLSNIEQLLLNSNNQSGDSDEPLTVSAAAKFLNLSVPTIYGKVCRKEIPVNKQGKRLYFYKSELAGLDKGWPKKDLIRNTATSR